MAAGQGYDHVSSPSYELKHNRSQHVPPIVPNHGVGKRHGSWQMAVPSWNGQSETSKQYAVVALLNYATAQGGQRRVLGGQLIQIPPDKSQYQLFAMRLPRIDPEMVANRIEQKQKK